MFRLIDLVTTLLSATSRGSRERLNFAYIDAALYALR
jgi:hypothetical protein